MGDSKNVHPEEHNMRRREVKAHQSRNAHARSVHYGDDEVCEFQPDFEGRFSKSTEEALMLIQSEHGHVTAGQIYQLIQEDRDKVVLELTGPEPALEAIEGASVGMSVLARPFAFRSFEMVKKENPETGEWEPQSIDGRLPFKCRSVVVPIASTGFAIKFKYNGGRGCIVVC